MKDLIKPIKNNFMLDDDLFAHDVCEKSEVRELEQDLREAIKALLDHCIFEEEENGTPPWGMVELLEKITGQKWGVLKELEL